MKKYLALLLALVMVFALAAPTAFADDYTIRIYSNSNSTERTTWLINEAKAAGFNISIDDNSVISGDTAAVQAANENKDGDLIFGLNETRWGQLIDGQYENLSIMRRAQSCHCGRRASCARRRPFPRRRRAR